MNSNNTTYTLQLDAMRTAVEVPYISALQAEKQSFVFDEGEIPESVLKNAKLTKYLKTGTTIAGEDNISEKYVLLEQQLNK